MAFNSECFVQSIMTGSILTMSVLFGLLFMRASHSMANSFTNFSIAYVTAPSEEVAKKLAHAIVNKKLAACVNVIPQILSVYEWDNKINEDKEILMMIKTRTSKIAELTEFVKSNHPYEVCEVISVPITGGNKDYLNWIEKVVPET